MTESEPQVIGFIITKSFLSDLSIENPFGPVSADLAEEIYVGMEGEVNVKPMITPDCYQVQVNLTLTAKLQLKTVFLAEISYLAEVRLEGIPDLVAPQILFVDVPDTVFPHIQEIILRNGGFAGYGEMHLHPLDFRSQFLTRYGEAGPKNIQQLMSGEN